MAKLTGGSVSALLLFFLLLPAMASMVVAQTPSGSLWRFGVGGGAVFALHSSSFDELPGIPQPIGASSFQALNNRVQFSPHLFAESPALFLRTSVGLQLDYQSLPALLQASEQFPIRNVDNEIITVTNSHEITATLKTVGTELFARIPVASALGVRLGVRADIPISDAFAQSQEITDPADLEFVGYDGKVTTASGALPSRAAFLTSLTVGVTYTLNNESQWPLQFGGFYRLGLTNIVSSVDWTMSSFAGTLSLLYAPAASRPVLIDTVFQRDTTVRLIAGLAQERVVLLANDAVSAQRDLPDATVVTVTITENYVREVPRPGTLLTAGLAIRFILNNGKEAEQVSGDVQTTDMTRHIFCSSTMLYDEKQKDNPLYGVFSRAFGEEQEQALGFKARDMQMRMLRHIKATWDSTGKRGKVIVSYWGKHVQEARNAADVLRRICAEAWGIKPENVPLDIQQSKQSGGITLSSEIEHLVSISFSPYVAQPLVMRDTVMQSPVRQVLFRPSVVSESGVRRWELRLLLDTVLLHTQSGEGNVPDELAWKPGSDIVTGQFAGRTVRCILTVEDRDGEQTIANGDVVFRTSGKGKNHVDKKSLRFIVEGLGLQPEKTTYIREQAQRLSLVPVQVNYWYAASVGSDPMQSAEHIARSLNVPQERVYIRVNPQSAALTLEAASVDILEILAGIPQPGR